MQWNEIIDRDKILNDIITPIVLKASKRQVDVYPHGKDVFKALDLVDFDNVKVCIIGQDPYHTPGVANGLAFSVNRNKKVPPSLQNIYKELESDLSITPSAYGDLTSWAKQGVLLLNTVLTVESGKPGSHEGMGWEEVTGDIITQLAKRDDPVIFVLWGKKALEVYEKYNSRHEHRAGHVLFASHPSPFSAHKGFFGCKHFSKINARLESMGRTPIDWSVE